MYSGPLLTHITSKFSHKSKEFIQKVVLLNNADHFTLNFFLVSQTGEEIFLKFFNTNNKKDWFYTFNTADVINRHQFEKRSNCYGENGFPVVGALLIDYKSTFLQVFPKFPTGAHMPKTDYFEIHLHRNPAYDDVLGLGSPLLDNVPVDHEFLFTFGELNSTRLWQTYLANKNSPHIFSVDSEENLSLELDKAGYVKNWGFDTHYSVGTEDPCNYLSRVFYRNSQMVFSILNTCEYSSQFKFNGATLGSEVQADGFPFTKRGKVLKEGQLTFEINKNTPETLWKYYRHTDDQISPFSHNSFLVTLNQSSSIVTSSHIGRVRIKASSVLSVNESNNSILALSVFSLFGISVLFVLIFSMIKMKSTKKLD